MKLSAQGFHTLVGPCLRSDVRLFVIARQALTGPGKKAQSSVWCTRMRARASVRSVHIKLRTIIQYVSVIWVLRKGRQANSWAHWPSRLAKWMTSGFTERQKKKTWGTIKTLDTGHWSFPACIPRAVCTPAQIGMNIYTPHICTRKCIAVLNTIRNMSRIKILKCRGRTLVAVFSSFNSW